MTFTKHFEAISVCCNRKFHRLRIFVNKKWHPSPVTILQIYTQCVRPMFGYEIVSTITVSQTVTKIQRVQNSFVRLALSLPKYLSARLLHESSGLSYVRERLITVGQNHSARMHGNPSLSIQSSQLEPIEDGRSTKQQFPFLNHQIDLMTLISRCRKMR